MATEETKNLCLLSSPPPTDCNHENCTEEPCNLSDVSQENLIPNIPDAVIIEEILPRLPAKPLSRFRCVSKTWNSSILQLINSRRTSILNMNYVVLGMSYHGDDGLQFCSLGSLYNEPNVDTFTKEFSISSNYKLVGSCDGLICVGITYMEFVLWNPCTKECNKLPKIPDYDDIKNVGLPFTYFCVFGKVDDDYKIVGFADCNNYHENIVTIYSLKANQWKQIDNCPTAVDGKLSWTQENKFVNGKVYWVTDVYEPDECWEIGYLDIVTETYGKIPAPSSANLVYDTLKLGVFEGCLYLLCGDKLCGDVWSLNAADESWTKVFTFVHDGFLQEYGFTAFHVLEISGEIMLMCSDKIEIFNKIDSSVRYPKLCSVGYIGNVSIYVPSSISPFISMIPE